MLTKVVNSPYTMSCDLEVSCPNKVAKATSGSAAFDLVANDRVFIYPGDVMKIPTGFHAAIPEGFVMFLFVRSGLASNGIMLANGVGVIDSDYRGEICPLLYNTTGEVYTVNSGDRVAQWIMMPLGVLVYPQNIDMKDWFIINANTERGSGGFGSTGK